MAGELVDLFGGDLRIYGYFIAGSTCFAEVYFYEPIFIHSYDKSKQLYRELLTINLRFLPREAIKKFTLLTDMRRR